MSKYIRINPKKFTDIDSYSDYRFMNTYNLDGNEHNKENNYSDSDSDTSSNSDKDIYDDDISYGDSINDEDDDVMSTILFTPKYNSKICTKQLLCKAELVKYKYSICNKFKINNVLIKMPLEINRIIKRKIRYNLPCKTYGEILEIISNWITSLNTTMKEENIKFLY